MTTYERQMTFLHFSNLIEQHNDDLATLETWELGRLMRYYAGILLTYQHPLYYHWQAPFINPQMEELNLVMESFLQTISQCIISFYGFKATI
ncbi:hypothetical protein ACB092_07G133100 [Castanea dentata]